MRWIDTHAHLDFSQFDADREDVLGRAWAVGLVAIVNAGADLPSSRAGVELSAKHERIFAAVGVHPHDAKDLTASALAELEALARAPKVVAIGEIGLDFYRDLSPRPAQRQAFEAQLDLAARLRKPVIVHDRDAHGEVMTILRGWEGASPLPEKGVLHCFSGSLEMALEAVELGFLISVAGPITYPNARKLPEIAAALPLDRLLVETDCPFLAPHPHRGKRNEPAYVALVAEAVARARGVPVAEVARITTANAVRVFGLEMQPLAASR
ncbi:MAG: TatD family hydrolase [Chloroflexi bacterium]|nr:TatD family hydrolase [Chloroflexota bacterium]